MHSKPRITGKEAEELSQYLTQDKHPQGDLFLVDVVDAPLKDILQQMEHPFYSLSKKPETAIRRYEHNGNVPEVIPSVKGLATIYDKDILVFAISKVMAAIRDNEPVDRTINVSGREFLLFTNRGTAGKDYAAFEDSLLRLAGTKIRTNIRTGGKVQTRIFGLIDAGGFERVDGVSGRLLSVEITLSDWVFNALKAKEVLTLHRDYFRLRRPIEKRLYELARKHCGNQASWQVSLPVLHKKAGSKMPLRNFRQAVRHLQKHDHLPDYHIAIDDKGHLVTFTNQNYGDQVAQEKQQAIAAAEEQGAPYLAPETFEKAKKAAPGYDVYWLHSEWVAWWQTSGRPEFKKSAAAAFIGFCKKKHAENPNP